MWARSVYFQVELAGMLVLREMKKETPAAVLPDPEAVT
jgi:hypothetical protein